MCSSFVYIVASGKNGQIHAGLTQDLVHRVWQHRSGQVEATGAPASCTQLVWHAEFSTLEEAEEQLERLSRWPEAWTNRLIEENNPEWIDLWANLEGQPAIGISPAFSANSHNTDTLYPILRPMLKVA